jgi:hypothetical protein
MALIRDAVPKCIKTLNLSDKDMPKSEEEMKSDSFDDKVSLTTKTNGKYMDSTIASGNQRISNLIQLTYTYVHIFNSASQNA